MLEKKNSSWETATQIHPTTFRQPICTPQWGAIALYCHLVKATRKDLPRSNSPTTAVHQPQDIFISLLQSCPAVGRAAGSIKQRNLNLDPCVWGHTQEVYGWNPCILKSQSRGLTARPFSLINSVSRNLKKTHWSISFLPVLPSAIICLEDIPPLTVVTTTE